MGFLFKRINALTDSGTETASLVTNCYTRSDVPGKTIEKSLGLIQFTKKGIKGNITKEIDGIFESLIRVAREQGANAVINVQLTTGSYEEAVNQWEASYLIVYGEAVILK